MKSVAARGCLVPRGKGIFGAPLKVAIGSGGALKLPQRVRAEPGRQTYSGAFKANILALWLSVE